MALGKKARPANSRKIRRELTQEEEWRILVLGRRKVFRVFELAELFRVSERQVREIIRKENPEFTESGVDPLPVTRFSFLLDERYSRALLKVASLATLRDETTTPQNLLELGIDLLCWIYGIKSIAFPGKMGARSRKRVEQCPLPSKFTVLRRLALHSGRIPDCERIDQEMVRTRKQKHWKEENQWGDRKILTGYGHWLQPHMLRQACLYYGIDLVFVRYHYPERGKYLSLVKLKRLSGLPLEQIHQETRIPKTRICVFFRSHGLKVEMPQGRYTYKIQPDKKSKRKKNRKKEKD